MGILHNKNRSEQHSDPTYNVDKKRASIPGDDLLFHPVSRIVPSALEDLTAGFGMGPGMAPPLLSPEMLAP